MQHPISPDKSIIEFCYRVEATDPLQVIDLACAESHHHRQANKRLTGSSNFRSGSKGRRYCDDLKMLVSILVNGQIPSDASSEYRQAIAPLVRRVLKSGWRVGDLESELAGGT